MLKIPNIDIDIELSAFCFGNLSLTLPIYQKRLEYTKISKQFVVISSSTGSGKTCLTPLFLSQLDQSTKTIFITQPTQIIVKQTTKTLKQLFLNKYDLVNNPYKTQNQQKLQICVCTPMVLIKYLQKVNTEQVIKTSRFILDEFHTRTIGLDILFSIITQYKLNLPCQLVLMSATPDQNITKLIKPSIVEIPLSTPYDVQNEDIEVDSVELAVDQKPAEVCVDQVISKMITNEMEIGGVLIFTSGKKECDRIAQTIISKTNQLKNNTLLCVDIFQNQKVKNIEQCYQYIRDQIDKKEYKFIILPIVLTGVVSQIEKDFAVSDVPHDLQDVVIKIIVATNIIETSITLDNLVVVINNGLFKEASFDSKKGINILQEKIISPSMEKQRLGRVGRTRQGYTFNIKIKNTTSINQLPEIQRYDLKQTILELKSVNVHLEQIYKNLPQPPEISNINKSIDILQKINAIDNNMQITEQGRKFLLYDQIDPIKAFVFESLFEQFKNNNPLLYKNQIIAVILGYCSTINNELIKDQCSDKITSLFCYESDIVTNIKVMQNIFQQSEQNNYCKDNGINFKTYNQIIKQSEQIYNQIINNQEIFDDEISNDSNTSNQKIEIIQQLQQFNEIDLILIFDQFVEKLINIEQKIQKESLRIVELNTISHTDTYPVFRFNGSKLLTEENDQQCDIYVYKRACQQNLNCFEKCYLFDIQLNESYSMFIGKYIHRLPQKISQNNYQKVQTFDIIKNSYQLPYMNYLIELYFSNNSKYNYFYKFYKTRPIGGQGDNYYYLSENQQQCSVMFKNSVQTNQLFNIFNQIQQIAQKCPETIVSPQQYIQDQLIEFLIQDKELKMQVINTQQTFCYSLTQQLLDQIITNKVKGRISLVVDCCNINNQIEQIKIFNDILDDDKYIVSLKRGQVKNKLIFISNQQIFNQQQLNYLSQEYQILSANVDENYKFKKLAQNVIPGISVNHAADELLFIQNESQIGFIKNDESTYFPKTIQQIKQKRNLSTEQINEINNEIQQLKQQKQTIFNQFKRQLSHLQILQQQKYEESKMYYEMGDKQKAAELKQERQQIEQQIQQLKLRHNNQQEQLKQQLQQLEEQKYTTEQKQCYQCLQNLCNTIDYCQQNIITNDMKKQKIPIGQITQLSQYQYKNQFSEQVKQQLNSVLNKEQQKQLFIHNIFNTNIIKVNLVCDKLFNLNGINLLFLNQIKQNLPNFKEIYPFYICKFLVYNKNNDKNFKNEIQKIIDQLGFFVSNFKYQDKNDCFNVDIRSNEVAAAFLNLVKNYFTQNQKYQIKEISYNQAKNKEVQLYISNIIKEYPEFNNIKFQNGYVVGDQCQAQNFIQYIQNKQIVINLPTVEIPYYSMPPSQVNKLLLKYRKIITNVPKNRLIIVPKSEEENIRQILQITESDSCICFGMCDNCNKSTNSILTIQNDQYEYNQLCLECLQYMIQDIQNQSQNQLQIQLNLGNISFGMLYMALNQKYQDFNYIREFNNILYKLFNANLKLSKQFKLCEKCNIPMQKTNDEYFTFQCQKCKICHCQNCGQQHLMSQKQCFELPKGFKRCPTCKAITEKISGCDHVTCNNCKTPFCFGCGAPAWHEYSCSRQQYK